MPALGFQVVLTVMNSAISISLSTKNESDALSLLESVKAMRFIKYAQVFIAERACFLKADGYLSPDSSSIIYFCFS